MSLLPYLLERELRPRRLLDQHFGLRPTPEDTLSAFETPFALLTGDRRRPWRHLGDAGSTIKCDKDKFQINVDVQHFAPEEISVKTADGYVTVEGKHEERQDEHGYISRQFVRRYALPEGCVEGRVESRLSSDGVLTVEAPRRVPLAGPGERIVPAQHTGPVRKESNTVAKL